MQRPHDQCVILSKNMADKNAIEKMISQDDLPIILISQMLHKTEIKGHHVFKDVCMMCVFYIRRLNDFKIVRLEINAVTSFHFSALSLLYRRILACRANILGSVNREFVI